MQIISSDGPDWNHGFDSNLISQLVVFSPYRVCPPRPEKRIQADVEGTRRFDVLRQVNRER